MGRLTEALSGSRSRTRAQDVVSMVMVNPNQVEKIFKELGEITRKEQTRFEKGFKKSARITLRQARKNLRRIVTMRDTKKFNKDFRLVVESPKRRVLGAPAVYVAARGPLSHLFEFGTAGRTTKAGAFRGKIPAHRFFAKAGSQTKAPVAASLRKEIKIAFESIIAARISGGKIR